MNEEAERFGSAREPSEDLGTWEELWHDYLEPRREGAFRIFMRLYMFCVLGMFVQLVGALASRTCHDNCILFQLQHPLGLALHERSPGWIQFLNRHWGRATIGLFIFFVLAQLLGPSVARRLDARAVKRAREGGK